MTSCLLFAADFSGEQSPSKMGATFKGKDLLLYPY